MAATLSTTLTISLGLFTLMWLIHVRIRDASIVDYAWAPGFALIAAVSAVLNGAATAHQLVVLGLVCLWSARLTWYLVGRHLRAGVEDSRYAAMRAEAGPGWWWQNLFMVFLLQGVLQWAIATPIHAAMLAAPGSGNGLAFWGGVAAFGIGLAIEAVADGQLAAFKRDPGNAGKLMTTGLWRLSRHPNYFGEIVLWWGLGFAAIGAGGDWWALAGPALLTLLILRVSGVTLLDRHMSTRPGWAAYAARTPALVPGWPRRPAG